MKYRDALVHVHAYMRATRLGREYGGGAYTAFKDAINKANGSDLFYNRDPRSMIQQFDCQLEQQTYLLKFFPIDDLPEQVEHDPG